MGADGIDITTADYTSETNPTMNINGDYIWAMATAEIQDGSSKKGEVVQKINKNTGIISFDSAGKEVFAPQSGYDTRMRMSQLAFVNDKPVFVIVNNNDISVNPIILSAVALKDDGTIFSNTPMTSSAPKTRISAVSAGDQLAIVWEDKRTENFEQIYAQNFKLENLTIENIVKNHTVKVYPNPAFSEVHIQADAKIKSVEIIDSTGRVVKTVKSNVILVEKLPSGVYILKTTFEDNQSVTNKIIKK